MGAYKTAAQLVSAGRNSSTASSADAPAAPQQHESKPLLLQDLPCDALEAILSHLNADELDHCRRVCRFLHSAALTPLLWQRLCSSRWPDANVQAWMTPLSDHRQTSASSSSDHRQTSCTLPSIARPSNHVPFLSMPPSGTPPGVPCVVDDAREEEDCRDSCHVIITDKERQPGDATWLFDSPETNHSASAGWGCGSDHSVRELCNGEDEARGAAAYGATAPSYASWREVYVTLCSLEPLVDGVVWSPSDSGADEVGTTAVVFFKWSVGCVEGIRLSYDSSTDPPTRSRFALVTSHRHRQAGCFASFRAINGSNIVITEARDSATSSLRSPMQLLSPAARAAAEVAASGGSPTCCSPPGSFHHEMGLFMQNSVAKPRRKSGRRVTSPGLEIPRPNVHHLQRTRWQQPSERHPLRGLWRMTYPKLIRLHQDSRSQVLRISYDFSGCSAIVRAEEVTARTSQGEEPVAAGGMPNRRGVVFTASAQPLPDLEVSHSTQEGIAFLTKEMIDFQRWLRLSENDDESPGQAGGSTPGWDDGTATGRWQVISSRHAQFLSLPTLEGHWAFEHATLVTFAGGDLGIVTYWPCRAAWLTRIDGDLGL